GLNGKYDFTLEWTPESGEPNKGGPVGPGEKGEAGGAADPSGPSLFTALQEQLGLKLEPTKAAVEIIIIDRAEKPSEN
ncbi:MAG TPA: TIGR03435 family protein, partial [Bryobacteraceae bacterium]|nr:TIGR03435 family protein [Bryobacteraceae bacterium]